MKTLRSLFHLVTLVAVALLSTPASAADTWTLAASAARTAAGNGSLTEIGNARRITVLVSVTAGSGTVNPFRVWIEGTADNGVTWFEQPCAANLKGGATAPGTPAAARDIVNETAVVTSAKYIGLCDVSFTQIRASWNIAGSTPSETFSVTATAK